MKKHTFEVTLTVEVDAFDEQDARDILNDTFGPGEECGVNITNFEIEEK